MGVCASKPESCVGGKLRFSKRRRKTRRSRMISKSLSLNINNNNKLVPIDESSGFEDLSSYVNPTFRVSTASLDEAWFDSYPIFEADWDDDFYSIQEDTISTTCSVNTCPSSFSSPRCQSPAHGCFSRISSFKLRRDSKNIEIPEAAASKCSDDQKSCSSSDSTTLSETSLDNQQHDDATSVDFSFEDLDYSDETPENELKQDELGDNSKMISTQSNMFDVKTSVLLVKVCRHRDDYDDVGIENSVGKGNYHVAPNSCLPCLNMSNQHGVDRRRSVSPSPPGTRKIGGMKVLPFRWRDEVSTPTLVSPRAPLRRPIAGSQIPYCPPEKKMSDCWSPIDSSTFSVRGHSFLRDKRKDLAPNHAAYYPFGVDVFRSHQKIDHIARFVELPPICSSGKFPPILVVNIQIPLYPASVFHREFDGEGMNVVLYFRLSENFSNDLPRNFQENLRRLIDDEKEKVKSFPVETMAPFRERLKILSRLANLDELNLNTTEKKLLNAYNEKPVLSRPQHEFYSGENYFEIDLDVHRFNYICRRGVDAIQDRLKHCVLDFGLTIQGNKPEDLPEHLLCCVRLNEIDFTNYRHLAI
ncbi:hypothetical protein RND81_10G075400 [Saponaria officinalis]|uniref:Protein ENHANCED DISEASE RESISTANCE 2 C-terminal domain-containing protein n=1 Tax=Saponaria officinalis TaxID=3572 RepID=A0AAW1HYQ9_SAPOF